jgi:hypothetical protein
MVSPMETGMSNVFTAVKPAFSAIDSVFTHAFLLLWMSTLQAQLRHARGLPI